MRGLVEGPASDLVAKLGARGDEVADQIAGVSAQASQSFDQQIGALVALLTRRGDDLLAAITATAGGSVRELGSLERPDRRRGRILDRRPARRRRSGASATAESIGALVSGLAAEVETSTAALRTAAQATQAQSSETISSLVSGLTAEIERCGVALRETVETDAGASVATLNVSSERMRSELGQVLERLGQVGSVLDRMVGAAGERLTAIEGGLSEKIEEMQRALGAMAAQVTALDRLSSETRDEVRRPGRATVGPHRRLGRRRARPRRQSADGRRRAGASPRQPEDAVGEIADKSQEFDAVARLRRVGRGQLRQGAGARPGDQRRADGDDQGRRRPA